MASNTGPDPLDDVRIPSHHAHQVAGGRRGRTAGHPAVEHGHAEADGFGPDGLDAGSRDGAHDDDRGAGVAGGQPAVGSGQDGMDLLVVDHRHHHHVGAADQVGRGGRHLGAVPVLVGGLGPHVAHHQGKALAEHAGGDAVADVSEADDADGGDGIGPGSTGRLVVRHWMSPCRSVAWLPAMMACRGPCPTSESGRGATLVGGTPPTPIPVPLYLDSCPDYSPAT